MRTLGPGDTALVCTRTGCVIAGINGRAARQQCMGQGWTAIIRECAEHGVHADLIACDRAATIILDQVVTAGDENVRTRPVVTRLPLITCDDGVRQSERGRGTAK